MSAPQIQRTPFGGEQEKRASFLKKRSKKFLLLVPLAGPTPQPSINRGFLLLFF
jgi:hypothetical protein